jgi:hypothetical protein
MQGMSSAPEIRAVTWNHIPTNGNRLMTTIIPVRIAKTTAVTARLEYLLQFTACSIHTAPARNFL